MTAPTLGDEDQTLTSEEVVIPAFSPSLPPDVRIIDTKFVKNIRFSNDDQGSNIEISIVNKVQIIYMEFFTYLHYIQESR